MKAHSLIGVAAAVLFAGAAVAQSPAQPATPATPANPGTSPATPATPATPSANASGSASGSFDAVDKDKDGSISKKEAASNKDLTKKWATLDANKDGKLDNGEFAQFEVEGSASGSMGSGADSTGAGASTGTSGTKADTKSSDTKSEKPKF